MDVENKMSKNNTISITQNNHMQQLVPTHLLHRGLHGHGGLHGSHRGLSPIDMLPVVRHLKQEEHDPVR